MHQVTSRNIKEHQEASTQVKQQETLRNIKRQCIHQQETPRHTKKHQTQTKPQETLSNAKNHWEASHTKSATNKKQEGTSSTIKKHQESQETSRNAKKYQETSRNAKKQKQTKRELFSKTPQTLEKR